MKSKSTLTALCSAITLSLVFSTGAYAATGQKVYSSGILVLAFLGFVALVVVVQLIPAMITLFGMIKGTASSRKIEAAEVSTH
jgi:hypothetical protein